MTRVRISGGGATDVGRLRDQNQDSILLGPVLFGVADGMGGHQGGEVASALAVEVIRTHLDDLDPVTTDAVRAAVAEANRAVFERSTVDPRVAGMGTTIVGVALVDDGDGGGPRIAVINVGDSRAYRYRSGELTQVSVDHSLVGELVRDGRITPEEAEIHPQRNVITRVLGIERDVVVDAFHFPAAGGDRYLLCSDGLTNEVPEADIAAVLDDVADPDEAAFELVRQANVNGGRDNITVIVVDVDGPELPDGVVPDAEDFSHHGDSDTEAYDPFAHDVDDHGRNDPPVTENADGDEPRKPRRERARILTWRSVLFVAVLVALLGGVGYLVNDYATNSYFVAYEDDTVAIFKGRPGGFLWIDPTLEEIPEPELSADDVPAWAADALEDGVEHSSLARARAYVQRLLDDVEDDEPTTTTTVDDADETTTTTTVDDADETTTTAGDPTTTTTSGG